MSPSLTDPLGYTSDAILDPKDRIPYTYRVGANQDKAQFLAYLENPRFTRSITLASLRDAGEYLIPHAQAYSSEEGAFVERYPYI
jgi:hypothetical protein